MTYVRNCRMIRIKKSISEFYSLYPNAELAGYAVKLLETIDQNPELNILHGKMAIWTSAIVAVIARLNFLLDRNSDNYMPKRLISSHFGTNIFTVTNKASLIQESCGISMFDSRFTKPEILKLVEFAVHPAEGDNLVDIENFDKELKYKEELVRRKVREQNADRHILRPLNQLNLFD